MKIFLFLFQVCQLLIDYVYKFILSVITFLMLIIKALVQVVRLNLGCKCFSPFCFDSFIIWSHLSIQLTLVVMGVFIIYVQINDVCFCEFELANFLKYGLIFNFIAGDFLWVDLLISRIFFTKVFHILINICSCFLFLSFHLVAFFLYMNFATNVWIKRTYRNWI